jgi:hypothetical protein
MSHADYVAWLDDDGGAKGAFHVLSTSSCETRPRSEWNALGRERYDRALVVKHAAVIGEALEAMRLRHFVVEHACSPTIWFPRHLSPAERLGGRLDYFRRLLPGDALFEFDGGFEVGGDVGELLAQLIDYPYLMRYRDVDLISLEAPILAKVSHHLSVDFIAGEAALLAQARRALSGHGLVVKQR